MSDITIHRKELVARGACDGGLTLFDRLADGRPSISVVWTPLHTLWLRARYPAYLEWLEKEELIPLLRHLDLRGANLAHADLSDMDLRDVDMRDTNLAGADMRRADMTGACLTGADLGGAIEDS